MGLKIILGRAGSGKTTYLYNEVIRMAGEDPAATYYFIVPEQFSIKTQYDLVKRHPDGGIMNIDVTSLARLAHKAFTALSGEPRDFLPEIAKSMIIKKVLIDSKSDLTVYGRNIKRAGFVEDAKALLSELFQYNIGAEELDEIIDSLEESTLKKKMKDARILLTGFNSHLPGGTLTNEGIYDAFAEIAVKSGVLSNSVVILDGFTGFTPSQYELLRTFMRLCKDVYISFTADKRVLGSDLKEYDPFRMIQNSVRKVTELAGDAGCDVFDPVITDYNSSTVPSLETLEKGIFRHLAPSGDKQGITVYEADNPKDEAKYVAMQVEKLIREEGYRYRDIAVVTGDMELFGEKIAAELDRVNAKYFIDKKKNLGDNEFAGLIKLMLRLLEKGWDTETLLEYAKNGMSGIGRTDACLLENYCIALGIRGSKIKNGFTKDYKGTMSIKAETANVYREKLVGEVKSFTGIKKATASKYCTCIKNALERLKLQEKLEKMAENFAETGETLRAKEFGKVYEAVISIFDEMQTFLGDEEMSATEFREIIEAGLYEARVGLVPEGSEQIVVGDIERTRLKDIKALFVVGANEGVFPKNSGKSGIITERDRNKLNDMGIELAPGLLKRTGRDRYYAYLAFTRPSEKLFVSYSKADVKDEELKPSLYIREITSLYKDFKIIDHSMLPDDMKVLSDDMGRSARLSVLREENAKRLGNAPYDPEKLSKEIAEKLYGEKLKGSITRLETFALCPFRFFLNYGIVVKERDEYSLENADYGTVAHAALELYGKTLKEQGLRWTEVSEDKRNTYIRAAADEAIKNYNNGIFEASEKNAYIAGRVTELLESTVRALTAQLSESDFDPDKFEYEFSITDDLLELHGKIDRIDVSDSENGKSVKVVDYKSSKHKLDLLEVYYGLSLQLPAYMDVALTEEGQGSMPAAMIYEHIQNPLVTVDNPDAVDRQDLESMIQKEYKPDGLVNSEKTVLQSLDHGFIGEKGILKGPVKSKLIPVDTNTPKFKTVNKVKIPLDAELDKDSKVAEENTIRKVCSFTRLKMKNAAEKIMKGEVQASPVKREDNSTGCKFCKYRDICGFDVTNGDREKRLKKYEKEDILDMIKNNVKGN